MSPYSSGAYGYSKPTNDKQSYGATREQAPRQAEAGISFGASGYAVAAPAKRGGLRRDIVALGAVIVLVIMLAPVVVGAAPFGRKDGLRLSPYIGEPSGSAPANGIVEAAQQTIQEALLPQATPVVPVAPAAQPETATNSDRPAIARRAADYNVVAPPSVSAATIDRVLADYNSPAQGGGALFYDLGVEYGIDPAYALAFFIHESAAGTKGVARFTNSIGNIRTTPGYQDYEGYRSYDSYQAGITDFYKLIREQYVDAWGLNTPDTILQRYAPWGDNNNPDTYAANVKQMVDSWQEK